MFYHLHRTVIRDISLLWETDLRHLVFVSPFFRVAGRTVSPSQVRPPYCCVERWRAISCFDLVAVLPMWGFSFRELVAVPPMWACLFCRNRKKVSQVYLLCISNMWILQFFAVIASLSPKVKFSGFFLLSIVRQLAIWVILLSETTFLL